MNTFFCQEWGDSATIFMSDEVTHENHGHEWQKISIYVITVYPKKYAHGFCFAVLCCGYTLTDFPISIRLTSLALWQSNDCPSASKATLMNMDKYFMWIHYERLHNHNKAKHNKTVCIFLGIYCICHEHINLLKTIFHCSSPHCCLGCFFVTLWRCDVTPVDLWCHVNTSYRHCDAILINYSCMCKLPQRPLNNNHEHWFPTTQYSRPSM